jgi:hypothetical protein
MRKHFHVKTKTLTNASEPHYVLRKREKEMTEKEALKVTHAEIRYGEYRQQNGSLGKTCKLYRLPETEAWLSFDSFMIIARRESMRQMRLRK